MGLFQDYVVLVKDGNGIVAYNETVRNSQLIINTSDPCSQYYATVAPVCQGTVPVASIGGSQIPGGNIVSIKMGVGGSGKLLRQGARVELIKWLILLCIQWIN